MKFYDICFSPTGGTKKVSDIVVGGMAAASVSVDLTDSYTDFHEISLDGDDVAVISVPSYGGRVPATAVERLTRVRGNGALAILVCVYGNRAYEDTLTELEDAAGQAGFRVMAAVAAIAQHSIAPQFGAGRPDAQDQTKLKAFAAQIMEKLHSGDTSKPQIPGNRPYKKSGGAGMVPKATGDCVKCGLCAEKCPVQAIDHKDPKKTDNKKCISCMRCMAICPHSARKLNGVMLAAVNTMLKKACAERKECELFI